jgi:ATP-dependent RNA helicase MSS116
VLILDEADRLLDQGFRKDLERIVGFLPDRQGTKRQCMLFSATFDKAIQKVGGYCVEITGADNLGE